MPVDEVAFWIGLAVGGPTIVFFGWLYRKTVRENREMRQRYGLPDRR